MWRERKKEDSLLRFKERALSRKKTFLCSLGSLSESEERVSSDSDREPREQRNIDDTHTDRHQDHIHRQTAHVAREGEGHRVRGVL